MINIPTAPFYQKQKSQTLLIEGYFEKIKEKRLENYDAIPSGGKKDNFTQHLGGNWEYEEYTS